MDEGVAAAVVATATDVKVIWKQIFRAVLSRPPGQTESTWVARGRFKPHLPMAKHFVPHFIEFAVFFSTV